MNEAAPQKQIFDTAAPQRVGGYLYHRDDDRWEWTDTLARIHGYEPRTVTPTTKLLLSHEYPDDRPHLARTVHAIRTAGGSLHSRYRIIDAKGVTRSIVIVSESVVDDTGHITGSSGFFIDISETRDSITIESRNERVSAVSNSRASIEQAKGMLMLVYGITADRAFDILVRQSQHTNVKLRDVAERLLTLAATDFHLPPSLRTHFDHLITGR